MTRSDPAVGKLDAVDERALLGEVEEDAADFSAAEAQVGIDARGLELVELGEHGLGDDDLGARERQHGVGVGEEHVGIENDDLVHACGLPRITEPATG